MELNQILEQLRQIMKSPQAFTPEQIAEVQQLIDQGLQQMRDADQEKMARALQTHVELEVRSETGFHPDGCYFCGGNHPSLGCSESQDWPH